MKLRERESNNSIYVSGKVVSLPEFSHEVFGEGFYTVMLESTRASGNTDTLAVSISERLIDIESLKVGLYISVNGQIRTFNKRENQEYNKPHLVVSVFAQELNIENNEYESDEVYDVNEVVLNGFLCKTPIYRRTPLGREICDILVAVNRPYGKSDYIPAVVWGRNASFMADLEVGTHLELSGRLQSRMYTKRIKENEDGTFVTEDRTAYEFSVAKMTLVE